MRAFAVKAGDTEKVGVRIDGICNCKKSSQWFSIQEINGRRILFAIGRPTAMDLLTPLQKEEEYKSDPV